MPRESFIEAVAAGRIGSKGQRIKGSKRDVPRKRPAASRAPISDRASDPTATAAKAPRKRPLTPGAQRFVNSIPAPAPKMTLREATASNEPPARLQPKPKGLSLKQATRTTSLDRRESSTGAAAGVGKVVGGLARVASHSSSAMTKSVVLHPSKAAYGSFKFAGDMVKGVATIGGLAAHTALEPTRNVLGIDRKGDGAAKITKRILKSGEKYVSDKYGPSYEGRPGARKHLEKIVEKEGPLPTALDMTTFTTPGSIALGKGVRQVARSRAARGAEPGVIGKAAAKTTSRPALKTNAAQPGIPQRVRPSATGATLAAGTDAARAVAQRAAKLRTEKRLRVRAVEKVTGKNVERATGRKPRVYNTEPKPLRARRIGVEPGEVVPLTGAAARRKNRLSVATQSTRANAVAAVRARKADDDVKAAIADVPPELTAAVYDAAKYGIRSPRGAERILTKQLALIDKSRADAVARGGRGAGPNGKTDAAAEAENAGKVGERAKIQAYLDNPAVFADPRVLRAAEAESRRSRTFGPREGLEPSRAATGRAGRTAETLGVSTVKQINERRAARAANRLKAVKARTAEDAARLAGETARAGTASATAQRRLARARGESGATTKAQATAGAAVRASERPLAGVTDITGAARATARDAQRAADKRLERAEKMHADARVGVSKAKGRAEVLSRNVGGGGKAGGYGVAQAGDHLAETAVLLKSAREAAREARIVRSTVERKATATRDTVRGVQGANRALAPVVRAGDRRAGASAAKLAPAEAGAAHAASDLRAARMVEQDVKAANRADLKDARRRPRRLRESGAGYEARVARVQKDLDPDLVPSSYTPSVFEKDPNALHSRSQGGRRNPLANERKGTLHRLGREDTTPEVVSQQAQAMAKRGAALDGESKILALHGKRFPNDKAAIAWIEEQGGNLDKTLGKVDMKIVRPPSGMAHKDIATPRTRKVDGEPRAGVMNGDYVKTDDVWVVPAEVADEWVKLTKMASDAVDASTLSKVGKGLAHYPPAIILALKPSWWMFQRVNDAIAATAGGSILHTRKLNELRRGLDANDLEIVDTLAGSSMAATFLKPDSIRQVGRLQAALDASPLYRKALDSPNPASRLLGFVVGEGNPVAGAATTLLRSDKLLTGAVRQNQFLYNLERAARRMDPEVSKIDKAFGPIGRAFSEGDIERIKFLLTDPKSAKIREEAAQSLYKVHGDWHNFTAAERKYLGPATAFYGFLRYATRMALFTLPLNHPNLSMLMGQLGGMASRDAREVIGPDQPYGLGKVFNSNGTVAEDFTRANPMLSPFFTTDRGEALAGNLTPLAGVVLNQLAGGPIALSNAGEGFDKKFTVKGDPDNTELGSYFGDERWRIIAQQLIRWVGPGQDWMAFDGRQQSSDSLPWSRKYLGVDPATGRPNVGATTALKLDAKNAESTKTDGWGGVARANFPLVGPGAKNWKRQGKLIGEAKRLDAERDADKAAKLRDPMLGVKLRQAKRELRMQQTPAAKRMEQLQRRLDRLTP